MDLTPCAVVLARSRTSYQPPFGVGFIEAKDVQASVMAPDLDVAVVRSVPLIERFENSFPEIGDGALHRVIMEIQRRHFDPPISIRV
jgi:hypothetical protein